MTRLIVFLLGVVALAAGLSWLGDQPGTISVTWPGYDIETSVFRAAVLFAFLVGVSVFLWSILRQIWSSPAAVGRFMNRRRQERGLEALSSGMIAIGAGDRALATRYAVQAKKALPNEPLTHLLRAQAAQLSGDRTTSRRIFEAMLGSPDTEQLGLRGLYLEAEREGESEAARQFAARAMELNPKLSWSGDALFDLQCKQSDWTAALETLTVARKHGHFEKLDADRRRAVLLTAQAQAIEESNGQKALDLALEAHGLAPALIPAATIAGRQLASRGSTPKAARVIERTWKLAQHPDLAMVYSFARPGDSPRDRLERIKRLASTTPHSCEGPIAVATAALDARNWSDARSALTPLLDDRLTQRVCTLMARLEGGERNNQGGVREWLARAVHAPRDPAWTADGIVSESWRPISPLTGVLDAFQWKVPLEAADRANLHALDKADEFALLDDAEEIDGRHVLERGAEMDLPPEEQVQARPRSGSAVAEVVPTQPKSPSWPGRTTASGPLSISPAAQSEASISLEIAQSDLVGQQTTAGAAAGSGSEKIVVTKTVDSISGSPSPHAANNVRAASRGVRDAANHELQGGSIGERAGAVHQEGSRRKRGEQRLFLPPRAPDDPGTDEDAEALSPRDFRAKPVPR